MSEPVATHEPRKLGLVGKATVALMVLVTAAFGVAAGIAIRVKQIANERAARTRAVLDVVWSCKRLRNPELPRQKVGTPRLSSFVVSYPFSLSDDYALAPEDLGEVDPASFFVLDEWGHPIRLVCPGPVHKNGWDLISSGPNGVYENGEGDDIVVGEDVPGGIASIESSR